VLDLARTGQIEVGTERVPLEDVADAYDRLREGRVEGRAVACPGG
jgi:alcohol dehydrogenase, propanol-preferring